MIRPISDGIAFVQLDDLKTDQLEKVRGAAFMIHQTSPGNHQAWLAVEGYSGETRILYTRILKALGAGDHSATGSTRLGGSENWKPEYLSSRENIRAFAGDPDAPLLLSLEQYDPETKKARKMPIFERRTLDKRKPADHVETAPEALAISLNETGGIHWPTLERLTGRDKKQLQQELDGLVYRNPEGEWETADRYLSGDVRAKLKAAEAAAAIDQSHKHNVEALKAVQPADLLPGDISARLGSSWIPATDVKRFISELLDVPAGRPLRMLGSHLLASAFR